MPAAFVQTVGTAAKQDHPEYRSQLRQGGVQADLHQIGNAPALDQGGDPEGHRISAGDHHHIHQCQPPEPGIDQQITQGTMAGLGRQLTLGVQLLAQPAFFCSAQPGGLLGSVDQYAPGQQTQQRCGQALDQEQPLPAVPAIKTVEELHDGAAQRAGDQAGKNGPEQEYPDHARAPGRWVPEGQVKQGARGEASFEDAEQKPQHVELCRRLHEHHGHGNAAPADHDAQQRFAYADFLQQQIAGYFEQQISNEENTRSHGIDRIAEGQGFLHLQLGVTDVYSIEKRHDIGRQQQRHDAPGYFSIHRTIIRGLCRAHTCLHIIFRVCEGFAGWRCSLRL
ncbi:hypothetical protein D9M71_112370 [compost metagenome]